MVTAQLKIFCVVTYFLSSAVTEGSVPQKPQENDTSVRAPLNSGEWESDWDSDFSLHVQPLSDLSVSSSDDDHWENRIQRRTSNPGPEQRTRKRSDKTTTDGLGRKGSKHGDTGVNKGTLNGGAVREGPRRSSAGETHVKERKSSRKTITKPIPPVGPGVFIFSEVICLVFHAFLKEEGHSRSSVFLKSLIKR